jgi:signal transduction histidine kinase
VPERRRIATGAVAVGGAGFGIAAEVAAGARQGLPLALLDFGVGMLLLAFGTAARLRRRESLTGLWMGGAGLAWFAGTLGGPLVALHRGVLVGLHLTYPSGRIPRPWLARVAVAAVLVDGAVAPLARDDRLTVLLAVLVAAAAVRVFAGSGGVDRRAAVPALVAAVAFAAILSLAAVLRLAGVQAERPVLWTYDLVIAALAAVLFVDLVRARWPDAVLRGLVVDLGALRGPATLQQRLARALGDPRLRVGIWDDPAAAFRDESGAVLGPPGVRSGLTATTIYDDDGGPLALLVHDRAAAADSGLLAAIAALARTAVTNRSLEARIAGQVREIAASRRRLVEAADAERRSLQDTIERGPERRLQRVSQLIAPAEGAGPIWALLRQELDAATAALQELADGVRPAELAHGLTAGVRALAARSPLDVAVSADVGRLPEPIEAAAYFVCAEALANAAKHAKTRSARVVAFRRDGRLVLEVADRGIGGADPRGSGLRGLADRVEALGGRLRVDSAPATGTRLIAELPADAP